MPTVRNELLTGLLVSLVLIGLVFWEVKAYNSSKSVTISTKSADISAHHTSSDCWIIVNNKILNVTGFLNIHPGGSDTITPYCGSDATNAFNSIKKGAGHSNQAVTMLTEFLVTTFGQNISPSAAPTATPIPTTTPVSSTSLTLTEISKHSSASDCWIIINSKVLKISPFLSLHPGGASAITRYCGQDATSAFNSIKGGSGHSGRAVTMIADFVIGLVGQSVSPAALTPSATSGYTIPRQEEDDDD